MVAVLVGEREADLDDLEKVDVAAQQLVLVVGGAAKLADRARHHARKLRVLQRHWEGNDVQ